ncbi:dihydrodipicolinate synthase family protein [Cyclobacterium xiamenense]|uniref:dihydrodipicolinate synthase family protein n=1 Tax=Cyclobacterium xiamenense TaxID=1297121 RepID=UPI0035CF09A7
MNDMQITTGLVQRRRFLKHLILGVAAGATPLPRLHARAATTDTSEEKAFVPVMLTPYKKDKSIDYKGLEALTDHYLQSGAKGMFANCLSSEMYELSPQERLKVTETVVKRVNGRFPVVATGSFGSNAAEKADFSKRLADTGVDAIILITSHFAEASESDDTMIRRLEEYLKHTESLALGTYECPRPYKRILSGKVLTFLLETDRLVYHKDTTEDIDAIREKLRLSRGSGLDLYNAHMGSAVASLREGAAGLSPIAGNYYPEVIAWICQHAADSERKREVDWLQEKVREMETRITANYQLSSRYYLRKSGLPMELTSRGANQPLTSEQRLVVDRAYAEVQEWKDQLGM